MDLNLFDRIRKWDGSFTEALIFAFMIAGGSTSFVICILVAFNFISSNNNPLDLTNPNYWYLFCIIFILCIILPYIKLMLCRAFFTIKQIPLLSQNPCRIDILLNCNDSCLELRNTLYDKIEEYIYENGLKDVANYNLVKDKHILNKYKTKSDLEAYKKTTDANIVIIAKLESGTKKRELVHSLKKIHILYKSKLNPKKEIFSSLNFDIREAETLSDIDIVGKNFYFLSGTLLSLGFLHSNNVKIADKLISNLQEQIESLKKDPAYRILYILIVDIYARVKDISINDEYFKRVKPNLTIQDRAVNEVVRKNIETINFYSSKKLFSYYGLNYKAILLFHLGDIKASKKVLMEIRKRLNKHQEVIILTSISLAFLDMWREIYKLALKRYKALKNVNFDTAQSVIDFCKIVIQNNPNRTDLYFTIALMRRFEFAYLERSDWETFLSKNIETDKNKVLFDYAKYRVMILPKEIENKEPLNAIAI